MKRKKTENSPVEQREVVNLEFDRRYAVSLFQEGRDFKIKARQDELGKIAERLNIPAVQSLEGTFEVLGVRRGQVSAVGHLEASLVRQCVITADDISENLNLDFNLVFVEDGDPLLREGEDEEYFPYRYDEINLGEALLEQTALEMNPYPRLNDVGLDRFVEHVPTHLDDIELPCEDKPNPFAVLKNLKLKDPK